MDRRASSVLAIWCLVLLVPGCAGRAAPETVPSGADPKLAFSTYIEEGKLVALAVSTRASRQRLTRDYIPFEIAVVNKGLEKLTLTPESFTLVTEDGNQYPVVGHEELSRSGGGRAVDRRFSEAAELIRQRFSQYDVVPSNLSPDFDNPVARDHLFLPRFSYIVDYLYFPRPQQEIEGKPVELFVRAPELKDPIFVRFVVGGRNH